ncbi:hypothetical protein HKCCE3408_09475 [Rhodobacterales bacterium HKCCE3408]|nr:hypothetical protein [Rhodobacterales bacterium HKCCE3408]
MRFEHKPVVIGSDDAVRRERERREIEKKIREIEEGHGVGSFDFGGGVTRSEKKVAKERQVILDALGRGVDVDEKVLAFHGLQSEPNPPVPDFDDRDPF